MSLTIREERVTALDEYATTPISFLVERVLVVSLVNRGMSGVEMEEIAIQPAFIKDYDSMYGGPTRWPTRFDVSKWGILAAYLDGLRVGGAAIAPDVPDLKLLTAQTDAAVLWDLRVHPDQRGCGVGACLFEAAEDWCRRRGFRWMKIETQNVNVAACRFYVRMGCVLGGIDRFAYPDLSNEVRLLWFKELR